MMKTMQVEEVFFDSADSLVLEEEELGCGKKNLGYDVWLMEPESVTSRRGKFLNEMGFVGFDCLHSAASDESDSMGLNRIVESSEAVCSSASEEEFMCNERESSGNANSLTDEPDQTWFDDDCTSSRSTDEQHTCFDATSDHTHGKDSNLKNQKMKKWWKQFSLKMCKSQFTAAFKTSNEIFTEKQKVTPKKVHLNKKKINEFSAIYCGQEISAHSGLIWTMKFSPDGKYLASAGEDGVVRIWLVTVDSSSESPNFSLSSHSVKGKHGHKKNKSCYTSVIVPKNTFKIDESPLHEFHGHTAGILDLAWSSSNCVLSSSKDKTVRLWKVGLDGCQGVFHHKNYVTCIQFSPVDENIFISGSIDGKVRIWGVQGKRVLEWADAHDIVTAVAYQPNGQGFIVGCISGTCRFYELNESVLSLNTQVHLHSRKKSSGSRITGIQFFENDSRRVMITSEDSKIHILDGVEIVHKYKGLSKSGSHTSATFSSTGKHIVSVGEDSRVYLWDNADINIQASKQTKSIRSCEHFLSEGISVAIPWSGQATTVGDSEDSISSNFDPLRRGEHQEASSKTRDSRRFSVGNWFSMDVSFRGSVTWPEEMLLPDDPPIAENDEHLCTSNDDHLHQQHQHNKNLNYRALSPAWGRLAQQQMGSFRNSVMKEKEEELGLFLEMRRREKERNDLLLFQNGDEFDAPLESRAGSSPIFNIGSTTNVRKNGTDDFLNADNDKNDYEWLLTPPSTPLFPSLEMESEKSMMSQLGNAKVRPTALRSRLANPQPEPSGRSSLASRQPASATGLNTSNSGLRRPSSSGGSRPSTPTGRTTSSATSSLTSATRRTSTAASKAMTSTATSKTTSTTTMSRSARSSTPTSRSTLPSAKSTVPTRSSTPTARSSTRSSTPTRSSSTLTTRASIPGSKSTSRAATPTRRPTSVSSTANATAPSIKSPSSVTPATTTARNPVASRPSSPAVKPRPWKPSDIPGLSYDAPPNLRTSLSDRPTSATRGRPGAPSARSSSIEPVTNGRVRRQSCSPARGRPPNGVVRSSGSSVPIPAMSRLHAKANDNVSPGMIGTKMVERVVNMRKLAPPAKQDNKHSPRNNLYAHSSSPDSTGFGRTLSKKSLDMAMRHMDIRQSISGNLRPSMTNIPASSMYSVRSGPNRTRTVSVSDSPLATSSNASSEVSVNNNTMCLDGSEVDDAISGVKGARSPAYMHGR